MKKISRLGIFDSGLGGYSVFQDLKNTYPDLEMILYADQKHAPYGNYSSAKIISLATEAMHWFKDQGIEDVLLACNTVSSTALHELHAQFEGMNIYGIIDMTLSQLEPNLDSVGVLATTATIASKAYPKTYKHAMVERSMPDLAKDIEALCAPHELELQIEEGLKGMESCSHIILGCTHYPLVLNLFEKHSNAIFVDSRLPIRNFMKDNYIPSINPSRIITTGDSNYFKHQIESLYKDNVEGILWK